MSNGQTANLQCKHYTLYSILFHRAYFIYKPYGKAVTHFQGFGCRGILMEDTRNVSLNIPNSGAAFFCLYRTCIRVLHVVLCHNPDNNSLGFHLEDCVIILKS